MVQDTVAIFLRVVNFLAIWKNECQISTTSDYMSWNYSNLLGGNLAITNSVTRNGDVINLNGRWNEGNYYTQYTIFAGRRKTR